MLVGKHGYVDPAVFAPARFRRVVGYGLRFAVSLLSNPRRLNALRLKKISYCLCPAVRQLLVVAVRTGGIRVTFYANVGVFVFVKSSSEVTKK